MRMFVSATHVCLAGVISSVGLHTDDEFKAFTPAQGYNKNVTYKNGKLPGLVVNILCACVLQSHLLTVYNSAFELTELSLTNNTCLSYCCGSHTI